MELDTAETGSWPLHFGMALHTKVRDYKRLFGLAPTHSLKLSSSRRIKRDGIWYETRWLDEHDHQQKLVARYHTWTHQALKPPYRHQLGWERYSLSGDMLDREVRYSKRDSDDYLH